VAPLLFLGIVLRGKLPDRLTEYVARHPNECEVAERFITLLARAPRCFHRDCFAPGHITGSAWLVSCTGDKVLLTHHLKLGGWFQLGGHADGDTDVLAVAQREGEEESGLAIRPLSTELFDIDIHVIPARKAEPEHLHFDLRFAFTVTDSEAFVVGNESHDLAWVPIADLASVTVERSMLRMAEKWLARDRATLPP